MKLPFRFLTLHLFIVLLSFISFLFGKDSDEVSGKHFIANYIECDLRSLIDLERLMQVMKEAIVHSRAIVLDQVCHVFPPNELKIVYLLSNSHASLHTYPELRTCFVDFFTIGNSCFPEQFDQVLRKFLQPKIIDARLFLRDGSIQEIPFP